MRHIIYVILGCLLTWSISYIFNLNTLGIYIVGILISFFFNNALPMKKHGYPFFRLAVIAFVILFETGIVAYYLNEVALHFFKPNLFWGLLVILGFVFGLIYSFGHRGNGTQSKQIRNIGSILGLIPLILSFVLFWWHGGVVYVTCRILFMMFEEILIGFVFYLIDRKMERYYGT